MEEHVKSALEIVQAQASVRAMTAEEIVSMVSNLSAGILGLMSGEVAEETAGAPAGNGKASIKEKSIVCLECGKVFKMLTKKHLLTHDITPAEYRVKHGLKKGVALVSKGLVRARRVKMKEMALWLRKGNKQPEAVQ